VIFAMQLFPILTVMRRRIAAFAQQVDRCCALMNGVLFAVAVALAFLVLATLILQNVTLPDPASHQQTPASSEVSTPRAVAV
jgi:hypothetical protein